MADRSFADMQDYLEGIEGVYSERLYNGEVLWFSNSAPTQHLARMIKEQKPARVYSDYRNRIAMPGINLLQNNKSGSCEVADKVCFYKDNYAYRQKRYYTYKLLHNCFILQFYYKNMRRISVSSAECYTYNDLIILCGSQIVPTRTQAISSSHP